MKHRAGCERRESCDSSELGNSVDRHKDLRCNEVFAQPKVKPSRYIMCLSEYNDRGIDPDPDPPMHKLPSAYTGA